MARLYKVDIQVTSLFWWSTLPQYTIRRERLRQNPNNPSLFRCTLMPAYSMREKKSVEILKVGYQHMKYTQTGKEVNNKQQKRLL